MKNNIILPILIGITILVSIVCVSLFFSRTKTITIQLTSYKADVINLGEHQGRIISQSNIIQDIKMVFKVDDQTQFRKDMKQNKAYLDNVSKENYYIFQEKTSFFYMEFKQETIILGNMITYFHDGGKNQGLIEIYDFPMLPIINDLNETTIIHQNLFDFQDLLTFCTYLPKDRYEIIDDTIKLKSTAGLMISLNKVEQLTKRDEYSLEIQKNNTYYNIKITQWYEDINEFIHP